MHGESPKKKCRSSQAALSELLAFLLEARCSRQMAAGGDARVVPAADREQAAALDARATRRRGLGEGRDERAGVHGRSVGDGAATGTDTRDRPSGCA